MIFSKKHWMHAPKARLQKAQDKARQIVAQAAKVSIPQHGRNTPPRGDSNHVAGVGRARDSGKATRPRRELARLGSGSARKDRPNPHQSRSATPRSPLTLWHSRLDSVPIVHSSHEDGVPVTHMTEMRHAMGTQEFERRGDIIRGSEFLGQIALPPAIGGATTTVPQGGALFTMPLNPLYTDGLRVARELSLYDQFRVKRYVVEYVPLCPSTQPGGIIGAVVPNCQDNPTILGGQLATRDLLSRPGSAVISAFKNAALRENFQQQKWYYVNDDQDSALSVPGMLTILNALDYTSTGPSVPLGLLWLHYEFQVRSEAFTEPPALRFTLPSASLGFTGAAVQDVPVALASGTFPSDFQVNGVVFWGSVAAVDLGPGPGPISFFTWTTVDGQDTTISPGMMIYLRFHHSSGTFRIYPSFGAALSGEDASWTFTSSSGALSPRGLKLWAIQGTDLSQPV